MSISRFNAVEKASNRKAVEAVTPEHKVSDLSTMARMSSTGRRCKNISPRKRTKP